MTNAKRPAKGIVNVFLSLVLALGLLPVMPAAAVAEEPADLGSVHVIVENTTFTSPVDEVSPAFTGILVDSEIALTADSTAMSCIKQAIEGAGHTQVGADAGYIRSVNGMGEFDGGPQSGWMGTLNDWFTSMGFSDYTVANGKLSDGDEIRFMYTVNGYGEDLGQSWNNDDKTIKSIEFSVGELDRAFDKDVHSYVLTVPENTTAVKVAPTASNKKFVVRTFVGDTQYKRTAEVPVSEGAVITVKSGYDDMDAADDAADAVTYTFAVAVAESEPERAIEASGVEGNINWVLYEDGELVVSAVEGTDGTMNDYTSTGSKRAPWVINYPSKVKSIKVEEGVTSIGAYAFISLSVLTSVEIGAGVSSIGKYAFSADSKLSSVSLPNSVTVLGERVFNNCTSLVELTIPFNVSVSNAFSYSKLQKVVFTEGVTSVTAGFASVSTLKTVELPKTVTELSALAFPAGVSFRFEEGGLFSETDGLILRNGTEIVYCADVSLLIDENGLLAIPNGVTAIGGGVFRNKVGIKAISFPDTLSYIGASAFEGCKNLESVTIPCNCVEAGIFDKCTGLKTVTFAEGVTAVTNGFAGDLNIEAVYLPSTLIDFSLSAFHERVKNFVFAEGGVFFTQNGILAKSADDGVEYILALSSADAVDENGLLVIPEGVVSIGDKAFYGIASIKEISFPSTLKTIGESAFERCSSLESVELPAGLQKIGSYAFRYDALKEVVLPCNAGVQAFSSNSSLTSVDVREGVTEIGSGAFGWCSGLSEVKLPSTLTSIDLSSGTTNAFYSSTNISTIVVAEGGVFWSSSDVLYKDTELVFGAPKREAAALVIPEGVTSIAPSALLKCAWITSVSFPSTLASIGQSAFAQCTGISGEVVVPDSVTEIGASAFTNCSGITGASLPSGLKAYDRIFTNCSSITELVLPDSVESLGTMNANFGGMTSLKKLVVPAGVSTFKSNEFSDCSSLERLEVRGISGIDDYTLQGCPNLQEIVLSAGISSYDAHRVTPSVIYYPGDQAQWDGVCTAAAKKALLDNGSTVVLNYDAAKKAAAPTITAQPQGGTVEQYGDGLVLSVEASAPAGESILYSWYAASASGTALVSSGIGQSECAVDTKEPGQAEYYCVLRAFVEGGDASEAVTTDKVAVTVTEAGELPLEGEGTEAEPYLIKTATDLKTVANRVNYGFSFEGTCFKLAADIALPEGWRPMGRTIDGTDNLKGGDNLYAFSGAFDGNGHTVTVPANGLPLFGYVKGATVKNLNIYGERINGYGLVNNLEGVGLSGTAVTIDNVTLKAGTNVVKSGLLGGNVTVNPNAACSAGYTVQVRNCTVEEGVTVGCDGDQSAVGSIAGRFQGVIENCTSYATVKGVDYVGGIAGTMDNAMETALVKDCTFAGSVQATGDCAGGIVGGGYGNNTTAPNGSRPSVVGCEVTGSVEGTRYVGGIFGGDLHVAQTWDNVSGTISGNQMSGKVSGDQYVGAIIGYLDSLNRYDVVEGNAYAFDCGSDKGIAFVNYLDTSCENPAVPEGTTAFNTGATVSGLPVVAGCAWKADCNRTDDPLGADADKLCKAMTYFKVQASIEAAGDLKVGDTVAVDVVATGNDGVAAMAGTISFDADQFELVSVVRGAGLSEDASFLPAEGAAEADFSFYGNEADAKGGIVVATATLRAKAAADNAQIAVIPGKAALEGDHLEYDVVAGEPAAVTVRADALLGDANNSGRVNIVDAQVVYDLATGKYGEDYSKFVLPSTWNMATLLWVCDVNADTMPGIDAIDAFAIQRYVHYGAWS